MVKFKVTTARRVEASTDHMTVQLFSCIDPGYANEEYPVLIGTLVMRQRHYRAFMTAMHLLNNTDNATVEFGEVEYAN